MILAAVPSNPVAHVIVEIPSYVVIGADTTTYPVSAVGALQSERYITSKFKLGIYHIEDNLFCICSLFFVFLFVPIEFPTKLRSANSGSSMIYID